MWHVTNPSKELKSCRTYNLNPRGTLLCYEPHIHNKKSMDRSSNNTFTYPMSARPTLGRIKTHSQLHINRTPATAESQHHLLPWYRQTQRPAERFPLDWNGPLLPELSSSYSAPQSFLQDLNSALPHYTMRGYQNGARTVSPADSPYHKTLSGEFLSPNHPLTEERRHLKRLGGL